ncbi:HAD-IB family hydrolase [Streptomyces sp. NPDC046727]|uniref:HAD family hydrolase n=1 Tax=Streptomyces sp. NPDC046727 TaxID=3155373 RepID=UPI0034108F25
MTATRSVPPAAAGRPASIVFADVDETLIACKSLFDFMDHYFAGGPGARRAQDTRGAIGRLLADGGSREAGNRLYYRVWSGERATDVAAAAARWAADKRRGGGFYVEGTRAALRLHREQGSLVVLVSGSFPALLAPIAAEVGADHLLCSRPEIRHGRYTGELIGEPVIGEGKLRAVEEVFRRYPHVEPGACHAYGDHISDLPMLAAVGHPVLVGDDAELRRALPHAHRMAAVQRPATPDRTGPAGSGRRRPRPPRRA